MCQHYKSETDENIKQIVECLFKEINAMGKEAEVAYLLNLYISRQHKTLQQSFVRVMHQFFIEYSDSSHDLRNEGAVKFSEKISKMEVCLPYI